MFDSYRSHSIREIIIIKRTNLYIKRTRLAYLWGWEFSHSRHLLGVRLFGSFILSFMLFPLCCFNEFYGKALARENWWGVTTSSDFGLVERMRNLFGSESDFYYLNRNYIIPKLFPKRSVYSLHNLNKCFMPGKLGYIFHYY